MWGVRRRRGHLKLSTQVWGTYVVPPSPVHATHRMRASALAALLAALVCPRGATASSAVLSQFEWHHLHLGEYSNGE